MKFEDDRCVLPKDFHSITAGDSVDSCKMWCIRNSTCRAFVFDDNTCHFKNKSCGIKYEMGGFTYYVKHGRQIVLMCNIVGAKILHIMMC